MADKPSDKEQPSDTRAPSAQEASTALSKLPPKEQLFVLYLGADPKRNGTKAAQRAGWKQTDEAAAVTASRLLRKAKVKAALDEELGKQAERIRKDGDYIIRRMLEAEGFDIRSLYNLDTGQLKPMADWPEGAGTIVQSSKVTLEPQLHLFNRGKDGKPTMVETVEIKIPDRVVLWDKLGRAFGIFKDSLDINLKGGLADKIRLARQRAGR